MNPTLAAIPQWLPVLLAPRADGRTDKIPVHHATGMPCNAHDPSNWTTHDAARALAAAWGSAYTVGFVLTPADPWFCVDIDGALQADGTWSPLSQRLVAALPGCMVEVSQSGRGLHIWGRFPNPPAHTSKRIDLHVECYTTGRFIAIGTRQTGVIADRCDAFPAFLAEWFPPRAAAAASHGSGPRADWRGPADDTELLRRAMQSRSTAAVFGGKASFADLWLADADVLRAAYPGDGEHGYDASSADAALAQHLSFWCGCDQDRIISLMQQSKLRRDKYDREDYLPRTVANACSLQRDVLQDKPAASPTLAPPPVPAELPGNAPAVPGAATGVTLTPRNDATILSPEQAASLFAGCFYVADYHRVACPGGHLYKPDQFRAVFGGYSFIMDRANTRVVRNAFEAFTESQAMRCPVVDGTCFRPDLPYGHVVQSEGRKRVNVYWPANVQRQAGDVTPFLDHLRRVLPNPEDQRILLYYMANCVQRPGHKAQWFPLLIGVEGNGKSLFSRCVAAAVGQRYTHWPAADKLGKDFNAWLFGKLFYAIEDLAIGDSAEVWEKLKPMITGEALEIEGKGIDQRTDEICGNFMANSNHRDAIRATKNDRRVCHLISAQEQASDLTRDGLTETYHSRLYDWLRAGGYAIIAEYLHTVVIPDEYGLGWFKGRAPKSSTAAQALANGMGAIEQEILDAVEREELGFRGGWISSKFLDDLLERLGRQRVAPINKRRDILASLGYIWHPALHVGRVNNPVLPDGVKSKLFVSASRADLMAITAPALVASAYTVAQGR